MARNSISSRIRPQNYNVVKELPRGTKVATTNERVENEKTYIKITHDNTEYLVLEENINEEIVQEKTVFVRTPLVLYENNKDGKINSYIDKGEQLEITGYDYIKEDGEVNMYEVEYNDLKGFVYEKYVFRKIVYLLWELASLGKSGLFSAS